MRAGPPRSRSVLKDVRGLEQKEAEDVLAFAARAVVDAALHALPRANRGLAARGGGVKNEKGPS
jgi:hypothetical protein